MIEIQLKKIEPTQPLLIAYIYQIISLDFGFSDEIVNKLTSIKPNFFRKDKPIGSWDLNLLNVEDIQQIFSDFNEAPDKFYYFENPNNLNVINGDYKDVPDLYTDIHQISVDKNGLVVMELFSLQIFELLNFKGEKLHSYCHDLHLGTNGLVLCRSSENNGGFWEQYNYDGVSLNYGMSEFFGPFDSPPDFPDIENRDLILYFFGQDTIFQESLLNYDKSDKLNLIKLLDINPNYYRFLNSYYAFDPDLAEKAVSISKLAFSLLSPELQHNIDFINRLLNNPKIDKTVFNYFPLEFKKNEKIVMLCLDANPQIVNILRPIKSKELLIKSIELGNWSALEKANKRLRKDIDCIKSAMRHNWWTLKYAHESLILNRQFLEDILNWYNDDCLSNGDDKTGKIEKLESLQVLQFLAKFFPLAIKHIAPVADLKDFQSAIYNIKHSQFKAFLNYCSEELKATPMFWLNLLEKNSSTLNHIPNSYFNDYLFVKKAVQINGQALTYANKKFRTDIELAHLAIAQIVSRKGMCNPEELVKNLDSKLINNTDFLKRVIPVWPYILNFINERQKNNEALFLFAVEHSYAWVFSKASTILQNKLDFVISALKFKPAVFNYIPENLKTNPLVQEQLNLAPPKSISKKSLPPVKNTDAKIEDSEDLPF